MAESISQTKVMSHMADNWPQSWERPGALILNPDAHHLELLAWCWSEVRSLLATGDACNASSISLIDLEAMFFARLGPVVKVMNIAISTGMKKRDAREAACARKGG